MGPKLTAPADLTVWPALFASAALAFAPVAGAAQGPAATSTTPAQGSGGAEVTAKERVAKGLEFYQAGNYDAAIVEFKAAYAAAPSSTMLYPWAQAERLRGNCRDAIDLYQRFIDSGPPQKAIEAAQQNRQECVNRIQSADAAASTIVPGEAGEAPAKPVEPETPAQPEGPQEPEPAPEPTSPPRARADALGWALVGGGAGLAIVGAGVLGGAAGREAQAAEAATYGEFAADKQGARGLRISGGVLVGVGLALAIGGAVRLALLGKRGGPARAWLEPRGLGVGGRF